jgi:hypothetical protein
MNTVDSRGNTKEQGNLTALKYEEQNTTAAPQGHNLDVGDGSATLTRTTTPQGHFDTWATDASTSLPDIRSCIQVGSDTFVLRTKPGTCQRGRSGFRGLEIWDLEILSKGSCTQGTRGLLLE